MTKGTNLSKIPEAELTPLVVQLLEMIALLKEENQQLRDEIARLKGQKPRPTIQPSALGKNKKKSGESDQNPKRPGSDKRSKSAQLTIHETKVIQAADVPVGSRFKGYREWLVQDLVIEPYNTLYRLEEWETPLGEWVSAKLPSEVEGRHFGPSVLSFILYQAYHAHVTQPLLLEELREFGIDLSAGQLNRILTENQDRFHTEKEEILRVGLALSPYVTADDTTARHEGKNGVCTHIGNEWFTYFASTGSKSRINFLGLLRAGHPDFVVNEEALSYMEMQKLPQGPLRLLSTSERKELADDVMWQEHLKALGVTSERHVRIATEGALLGSALSHGVSPKLAVISDDAGQFDVLLHGLCWIHAERVLAKLIAVSEEQRQALEAKRCALWEFYQDLKAYKAVPTENRKAELEARFDSLFLAKTCFATLNQALRRIHKNKDELLLVLQRPEIPLHQNGSERDIREYVTKRKVSGSTRSRLGRMGRDTFASLKKTCRKLAVSFWTYLNDRVRRTDRISPLPDLLRSRLQPAPA